MSQAPRESLQKQGNANKIPKTLQESEVRTCPFIFLKNQRTLLNTFEDFPAEKQKIKDTMFYQFVLVEPF